MNKKLIEQIKAIKGVKKVNQIGNYNLVTVSFEPQLPVIHDEYGVALYDGDQYWYALDYEFYKRNPEFEPYRVRLCDNCIDKESSFGKNVHIFASLESAERWCEENKPKPIYTDPETDVEFFEGDETYYFGKSNYNINPYTVRKEQKCLETSYTSKVYKSRKECEIALANYILNKYK